MSIVAGVQVSSGMGKHIPYATDFVKFANAIIPAELFYILTLVFTKLSVLYFYRRIFPNRPLVIMSNVLAVIVIAYSAAMIIVISVFCRPNSSQWDSEGQTGICVYRDSSFIALAYASPPLFPLIDNARLTPPQHPQRNNQHRNPNSPNPLHPPPPNVAQQKITSNRHLLPRHHSLHRHSPSSAPPTIPLASNRLHLPSCARHALVPDRALRGYLWGMCDYVPSCVLDGRKVL